MPIGGLYNRLGCAWGNVELYARYVYKHALNKVKGYGRGECFVMKENEYKVFLVDHCAGGLDLYSVRGSWNEM